MLCAVNFRMMKRIYRHKAITEKGETFRQFSTKAEIEEYIESQIESRGLDWRAGYLIRFRDRLQLEFVKMNGDAIKT
jgi:hypothetical protein